MAWPFTSLVHIRYLFQIHMTAHGQNLIIILKIRELTIKSHLAWRNWTWNPWLAFSCGPLISPQVVGGPMGCLFVASPQLRGYTVPLLTGSKLSVPLLKAVTNYMHGYSLPKVYCWRPNPVDSSFPQLTQRLWI